MAGTLGVIGGLGPAATLDFHAKLLSHGSGARDQDHLRLLIDSDPTVPDRNAAIAGTGESPGPHLARIAAGLERGGADLVVMACNAAHAWESEIRAALTVPFLSIIEVAVGKALQFAPKRVGLLAADATVNSGIYQRAFAEHGIETVNPDQTVFMDLLYRIKAGERGAAVEQGMLALADSLEDVDVLIAGCTEVPLVLKSHRLPFIDAGDELAKAAVARLNGTDSGS